MLYKDDWDKASERLAAWWDGELIDRPVMQVCAPRKDVRIDNRFDGWALVKNLDRTEWVVGEFRKHARSTYWGAEAVPNMFVNFGPGVLAAFLGVEPRIMEDTVWFEVEGGMPWDEVLRIRLDPDNRWWKEVQRVATVVSDLSAGDFIVGGTDLNAEMNVLGSFRGTQNLLFDLLDRPADVHKASDVIHDAWLRCYDRMMDITLRHQQGTMFWMNIWCPERCIDVQCDFSAMISPDMFREFVLPHVQDTCSRVPYTIFHLDGPGQIPHLQMLLDLPDLNGIQWVPGAGNPGTGSPHWFPMYNRIQDAGKLLVLQGMNRNDVRGVAETLDPRGLLIETSASDPDEADRLISGVADWSRR
ncbi:MAG: hypothetical protein JW909_13655 [Planctomycetes bacterium]|nr:hypothetical protein [Planctomycetota bacterium]